MKTVLLIEDDRTMQSLLKTLLEIDGYAVFFPSGMDQNIILEYIKDRQPNAIIMDVNLRQASGINILTAIKNDPQIQSVKVLMSSGLDLKNECITAGADGFLQKPYMPDELLSWLRTI